MKSFEGRADELRKQFDEALARVKDRQALEDLRNDFLSRKRGLVTLLFEELKSLPAAEKPGAGKLLNELKIYVQEKLSAMPAAPAVRRRGDGLGSLSTRPCRGTLLPGGRSTP